VLMERSVAEQRYQVVLAVIQDGLSVTEIAEKAGVHRQTVHRWLSRYAEDGLAGLSDRSHRPRSCPHQMDPALEVRLVELRQLHPGWGPDRLRYRLGKEGRSPVPSRAAIARALVRLGLVVPGRSRHRSRTYRRWERGAPMELWQLDVMGGVLLTDGRELKAVTGIDDHSRFSVAVGLVEQVGGPRSGQRPEGRPARLGVRVSQGAQGTDHRRRPCPQRPRPIRPADASAPVASPAPATVPTTVAQIPRETRPSRSILSPPAAHLGRLQPPSGTSGQPPSAPGNAVD